MNGGKGLSRLTFFYYIMAHSLVQVPLCYSDVWLKRKDPCLKEVKAADPPEIQGLHVGLCYCSWWFCAG